MAWLPDITVDNIRDECAVITVPLKDNDTVEAAINGAKAYFEAVLRKAGYVTTNPADDLSLRDAAIAYVVARLLSSIYGSQQWNDEVAGAARGFWSRVRMFIGSNGELVGVPNIALADPILPTVHNIPVSDGGTLTQFDTDTGEAHSFPVHVDDDDYAP